MFAAFFAALGQLGDRRFRRVLGLGVLLALALLFAAYLLFLQGIWWLAPDTVDLPVIGPVSGIDSFLGWTSLFLMLGLSVFLMIPVAAAFTGFFLEDVADAVEDRHYPHLPPATALSLSESLRQAVNFLGVVIAVNLGAVFLYPLVGPGAPLVFWAVNGYLLGREYFSLVALRRLPPSEVRAMRRRNRWTLWAAGTLMAAPLSLPLVNLVIPTLGVATFTHIFHRLAQAGR
ncbi:MAG: EI24 domain-containing protein [Tabrizicola flagellatus]|uniref:EI24 domain-containing protein n=1 Tax=Tabrizicola flagellatus TaxID=2593021 RepID=UPI003919521F